MAEDEVRQRLHIVLCHLTDSTEGDGTAAQKVFDTTELLEQILLRLPVKDLLLNQRVCATWKACIDNSVKLQRGLFFRTTGAKVQEEKILDVGQAGLQPRVRDYVTIHADKALLNPIMLDALGIRKLAYLAAGELDETTLPLSFQRPEASWRRMTVTQPPLPALGPPEIPLEYGGRHERLFAKRVHNRFYEALMESLDQTQVCCTSEDVEGMIAGTFSSLPFYQGFRFLYNLP